MGNKYKHLCYYDRLLIEKLARQKRTVKEIVEITGFSKSTIYRQLSCYKYEYLNSDYTIEMRYSAELSQNVYNENRKRCKKQPKLLCDSRLMKYVVYLSKT